uniref:Coatomer subunit delta n=1 Tax=Plectus sambesii TaxID=2011161 RepID=A0A914UQC3_9BILA
MVLLAAAICTKPGKALVSRQFVEMTRARIEGLLAAFPKLISSEKGGQVRQHTFVETDSVRYVYQPMDLLYVVLITTKASNILEDLETLRLFSRVIPEYCRSNDEKEILDQAFQLIFAFDEIVALGYRENVNLAQIRTFTEMDSHEERVFWQIKKTQEEEARKLAKDKAKELQRQRADAIKRGGRMPAHMDSMSGMGSQSSKYEPAAATDTAIKSSYKPPAPSRPTGSGKAMVLGAKKVDDDHRPTGSGKAMVLGAKKVDDDQFIKQLKSEGQEVSAAPSKSTSMSSAPIAAAAAAGVKHESVHIRIEEKMNVVIPRDGGLDSMEVLGLIALRVSDPQFNTVKLQLENRDTRGAQLQTHPNLDKTAWSSSQMLRLKSAQKPFPVNNDVGVLKWRLQTTDETLVPLTVNCWPSDNDAPVTYSAETALIAEKYEIV